jgi:hypothetical protein
LTSENNAATSESNAATSAANAEAAYDDFDDRYLGAKATAPTVDNDGDPLIVGALYFDTTLNEMRVYDGAVWKAAGSTVNGTAVRQTFTATAGQTTFAVTGGYDAGFADVYLNGVKLVNGVDVNVSSGTNVVLTVGAAAGDSVDVIAYGTFLLSTHVAKAGDTMTGDLTLASNLNFSGNARRITGDFSNATVPNRVAFQTSTVNGLTVVGAIPNGTSQNCQFVAYNNSDLSSPYQTAQLVSLGTEASFRAGIGGGASHLPMTFYTGGSERVRIDTSGNVGIGTSSPNSSLTVSKTTTLLSGTGNQFGVNIYPTTTGECFVDAVTGGSANADISFRSYNNGTYHRMLFNSSGNLLVGTTTTGNQNSNSFALETPNGFIRINHINGTASGTGYVNFALNANTIGNITQNGTTAVSYNTSSDYRLKHDIQPMTGALAKVAQLKPVTYKWNADDSQSQGFIAHELQEVVPECVTGEKDAVDAEGNPQYQGIDTSFLVATLTAAIQEQQALIASQSEIIESLKTRIEALEGTQQ